MKTLFLYSYPIVGLISFLGYLPQIKALFLAKTSPVNVSIRSWLLWVLGSMITLGYGVTVLHDTMFCMIAVMNMALNYMVVFLILYRRYVTYGPCHDFVDALTEYFCRAPYLGICPNRR